MTNREKLLSTLNEALPNGELCELAASHIVCADCPAKSYCDEHSSVWCCSKKLKQWINEDEEKQND